MRVKGLGVVYVSEEGEDSAGHGSAEKPFKNAAYAVYVAPDAKVMQKKDGQYEEISASGLKKAKKGAEGLAKKAEKARQQATAQAEKEAAKLAAAEAIQIEKPDLAAATKRIFEIDSESDERIVVKGWVQQLRVQKGLAFMVVRDGTGYLQVVLSGDLANCARTQTLTLESTVAVYGKIHSLPEGKHAPGNRELVADYYDVIGLAPGGQDAFTNKVQEGADPSLLMDQRHLTLRGETLSSVMKVRQAVLDGFRAVFKDLHLTEVTPPCMVQTQVEGGSTLFKFEYYGEDAYLTQSSQLYLETLLPSLGDVFCIQESFRAERSHTRRHLSEYTHLESELAFLSFDEFLTHIETVIVRAVEYVLEDPIAGPLVQKLNPGFEKPKLPFLRMTYEEALKWLNDHEITNEEGKPFEFGDDIAEAEERKMTDAINQPILLNKFPLTLKSFYMKKTPEDARVTESVDVLMPGVGEIVGGSMRIDDTDELLEGFKREGISPEPYYWYIDQRRYGTCPHGGYGLGVERLLAWLCNRYTVRDCSLYPRYTGRCKP
ncbi:hypothetical protein CANCADRAFT_57723 [Tortispora caseinolytica NRRL Y-17796]|uniref:asparagine--tRNA ligase n=1 Tax=Tortispora caseinolytica NRRL Y-17796 TaxID=767744 RepID=A0A1E4T9Z8_9ASCO|nr:hypothetical protein CANCADRAFT_57723 [Tortispora caseinolytica NRRL Y-17796]